MVMKVGEKYYALVHKECGRIVENLGDRLVGPHCPQCGQIKLDETIATITERLEAPTKGQLFEQNR